ncbi:DNA-dependent metalloprotease SPRTN [Aulostomus maculatus]
MDEDFLLAIQLQEQFDNEYETSVLQSDEFGQSTKKRRVDVAGGGSDVFPYRRPTVQPERPLSIVDESWEMLDPNPDVRAMFLEFNDMFFWGKLSGVEVKWSPRMTLCAGVCSYEGRGGLCSIRLSEPLLKLRPRKDLVQTLLHEMIHALLFVTQNNRDRDGHGPEFCKHMNRINQASGTKITVYHSFHDEVDVYRQHWWRCDGPCQTRKPFFGYVKRAMNRAPSALDPWWGDHQRTCGGTYTKIKEPEGYSKKGKKDDKKEGKKVQGSGKPSSSTPGSGSQDIRNIIPFSGRGFLLGGKSSSSSSPSPAPRVPVVTPSSPSSSPVSSPTKPLNHSSLVKSLNSPLGSGLDKRGTSSFFPAIKPTTGPKPPVKRSVGNTRVFVSINGSPVRISKPGGGGGSQGGAKAIRQKSIEELFSSAGGLRKRSSQSSLSDTKGDSPNSTSTSSNPSSPSTSTLSIHSPTKRSPDEPTQSKYFHGSNSGSVPGTAAAAGVSRKRTWDERNSASIFDFFQKTLGSDAEPSGESGKTKPPAGQQRTATSSSTSSTQVHSATSSSSSSSSSSLVTVHCPVCQAKVQESKINEHLDSCLS